MILSSALDKNPPKGTENENKGMRNFFFLIWISMLLWEPGCAFLPDRDLKIPWMSQDELRAGLGNPDFLVVDVRKKSDWEASLRKIPGAFHEDYEQVKVWASKFPRDKTLVLYCA
jgi:hypothetical protein